MKFNALALTLATALAGSLAWATPAHAATSCTNDIDCKANGTACGTDICDWNNNMVCAAAGLPANKGMDGWCSIDSDCKCASQGATCLDTHYCTFTQPKVDAGSSGAAGSGSTSGSSHSGSAGSGSATSGAGTSGAGTSGSAASGTTTGGTTGGGGSSGCSVGAVGSSSPWAGSLLALGACFAAARRRRK